MGGVQHSAFCTYLTGTKVGRVPAALRFAVKRSGHMQLMAAIANTDQSRNVGKLPA